MLETNLKVYCLDFHQSNAFIMVTFDPYYNLPVNRTILLDDVTFEEEKLDSGRFNKFSKMTLNYKISMGEMNSRKLEMEFVDWIEKVIKLDVEWSFFVKMSTYGYYIPTFSFNTEDDMILFKMS